MTKLPFNRISVVLGATKSDYMIHDFLALPLSDRVKSILFGRITFFADDEQVNTTDALNALRTLSVPSS